MKNCILNVIASAAERTAKSSVNSASFFTMYQPKEPDALKKDGVTGRSKGTVFFRRIWRNVYEKETNIKCIFNNWCCYR